MEKRINKIREGCFDAFYSVLVGASKKNSPSNFLLNELVEIFIYFKFLFDHVDEILIFTESLDLLPSVYAKAKEECKENSQSSKQKKLQEFWNSLGAFVNNENKKIQVIYRVYNDKDIVSKSQHLPAILSIASSKQTIRFWQLNPELSLIKGLSFFILVPQYDMVYTAQELEGETWNVCYFKNKKMYNNARVLYDCFLQLSEVKKSIPMLMNCYSIVLLGASQTFVGILATLVILCIARNANNFIFEVLSDIKNEIVNYTRKLKPTISLDFVKNSSDYKSIFFVFRERKA